MQRVKTFLRSVLETLTGLAVSILVGRGFSRLGALAGLIGGSFISLIVSFVVSVWAWGYEDGRGNLENAPWYLYLAAYSLFAIPVLTAVMMGFLVGRSRRA